MPESIVGMRPFGAKYIMAPMAGITDLPFRLFMRRMGAELVVSELISAEGLAHGSKKTREMMRVHPEEHPGGLQIFGADIPKMCEAAHVCEEMGADFVDINFGCPVPKVVKCGAGSAMLKNPSAMGKLLSAMTKTLSIPLSIKIRSGWDESSINAHEILKVAADSGVAWVSVHARTRSQGYAGEADWNLIRALSETSPIPLIGNGDIRSAREALAKLESGYAHAVMIGRAAIADPYIFWDCRRMEGREVGERKPAPEMLRELYALIMEHNHPKVRHTKLKKLFVWFAGGMPGKGPFRQKIFSLGDDPPALLDVALNFLTQAKFAERGEKDLSFLKGGHG